MMKNVYPIQDKQSLIKNPYMGWMVYVEYSCTLHKEHEVEDINQCINVNNPKRFFKYYDEYSEKGLFANILYLRVGWSWFEPHKGEYAWRNPDSVLATYIRMAKDRHMQIAFRILSGDNYDSEDKSINSIRQTLPPWIFKEEGFEYYHNKENSRCPYYDNPVYLKYYEKLIEALSKDFDDNDVVAFIDAQGLGMWGEMHDVRGKTMSLKEIVENHAKIWNKYFHNVLLGATFGCSADEINKEMTVPYYRYMIRRDGYGSDYITPWFTDTYLNEFFPKRIASYGEICYWHLGPHTQVHFERDRRLKAQGTLEENIREYLELCIKDVQKFRANTLDLRVPSDWVKWLNIGRDLVDQFALENGYRLSAVQVTYSEKISKNEVFSIEHYWKNDGYGMMPITNNQLSNQFRVAFALIDKKTHAVHAKLIEKGIEPNWIKEDGVVKIHSEFTLDEELEAQKYELAVGIIKQTTKKPVINLAMKTETVSEESNNYYGKWYIIGDLIVEQ